MLLPAIDWGFTVFHTALVVFNLLGWLWPPALRWNLLTLVLTGASWIVFTPWYGFGYCPCTDWHWRVRIAMGDRSMPDSYVEWLFERITPLDWDRTVIDVLVAIAYLTALGVSATLNWRRQPRRLRNRAA